MSYPIYRAGAPSPSTVLLAGCGGGYDVLGAVPLLVDLLGRGCKVVLASHSFTNLPGLPGAVRDETVPCLFETPAGAACEDRYCPEPWLARWAKEALGEELPSYAMEKSGAQPLLAAYRRLIELYRIDTVVLVDGGIDALLRGDESSLGTPAEDLASLAAASQLPDEVAVGMACLGLGAEMRDGICHEQVFARIAELTREGGFYGAQSLAPQEERGRRYLEAVDYVFAQQATQRRSHVHKVVSQAVRGEYGADGEHIWVSPLLSQCWFFDARVVARTHRFLPALVDTETSFEVSARVEGLRKSMEIQGKSMIPI